MRRIPVRSMTLRSIGYDPATRTLEAEFRSGRIYRYAGVPLELYLSFLVSRSKGRFFNVAVRDFYPYREVEAELARAPAEKVV
jgi:hypothetical protein